EERYSVSAAPGQRIRRTQGPSYNEKPNPEAGVLIEAHRPFEQGDRPAQIALAKEQCTNPPQGIHEARRVSSGLSHPEPLFPAGPALSEHAELSMGHSEICTTEHGGQSKLTDDVLTAWRRVEARYGLRVAVYRPTIVTLDRDGHAEVVVRQPVRDDL